MSPPLTLDQIARNRIRLWMQTTGIDQKYVSEQIGRNQPWLSRYLKGDLDADVETLHKLAKVFGHTLYALLNTPADPRDARLLELFNALPEETRGLVLKLLASWQRPPRGSRIPQSPDE